MQKQKLTCNYPSTLEKLIPGTRKIIAYRLKKTKRITIESPTTRLPIKIITRLSPTIPPSLLISLKPRPSKKTSAVVGEAI